MVVHENYDCVTFNCYLVSYMVRDIKRKVVKGLVKIKMKLTAHEDFVIGI